MIKISMLTSVNIVRNCLFPPGKLKKNYILSQLMEKGHVTLHTCKGVLASDAMPKDELQLPNAQMKKLESKNNKKKKLR